MKFIAIYICVGVVVTSLNFVFAKPVSSNGSTKAKTNVVYNLEKMDEDTLLTTDVHLVDTDNDNKTGNGHLPIELKKPTKYVSLKITHRPNKVRHANNWESKEGQRPKIIKNRKTREDDDSSDDQDQIESKDEGNDDDEDVQLIIIPTKPRKRLRPKIRYDYRKSDDKDSENGGSVSGDSGSDTVNNGSETNDSDSEAVDNSSETDDNDSEFQNHNTDESQNFRDSYNSRNSQNRESAHGSSINLMKRPRYPEVSNDVESMSLERVAGRQDKLSNSPDFKNSQDTSLDLPEHPRRPELPSDDESMTLERVTADRDKSRDSQDFEDAQELLNLVKRPRRPKMSSDGEDITLERVSSHRDNSRNSQDFEETQDKSLDLVKRPRRPEMSNNGGSVTWQKVPSQRDNSRNSQDFEETQDNSLNLVKRPRRPEMNDGESVTLERVPVEKNGDYDLHVKVKDNEGTKVKLSGDLPGNIGSLMAVGEGGGKVQVQNNRLKNHAKGNNEGDASTEDIAESLIKMKSGKLKKVPYPSKVLLRTPESKERDPLMDEVDDGTISAADISNNQQQVSVIKGKNQDKVPLQEVSKNNNANARKSKQTDEQQNQNAFSAMQFENGDDELLATSRLLDIARKADDDTFMREVKDSSDPTPTNTNGKQRSNTYSNVDKPVKHPREDYKKQSDEIDKESDKNWYKMQSLEDRIIKEGSTAETGKAMGSYNGQEVSVVNPGQLQLLQTEYPSYPAYLTPLQREKVKNI